MRHSRVSNSRPNSILYHVIEIVFVSHSTKLPHTTARTEVRNANNLAAYLRAQHPHPHYHHRQRRSHAAETIAYDDRTLGRLDCKTIIGVTAVAACLLITEDPACRVCHFSPTLNIGQL